MKVILRYFLLVFIILLGLPKSTIAQDWQWARTIFGLRNPSQTSRATALAVDEAGNSYVTGYFDGEATFDNIFLKSSGHVDMFVAKYDSKSRVQWVVTGGGYSNTISVDKSGNLYVAGIFYGSESFEGITLTSGGAADLFIAKYNTNGNLLWVKKAGGNDIKTPYGITSDQIGNIYVTGKFNATATFGNTVLSNPEAINNLFIAKYDLLGNLAWVKQAGGNGYADSKSVDVDENGNCYFIGTFSEKINFGATSFTSRGGTDAFVAKYNSDGNQVWVIQAGGKEDDAGNGIALDKAGNSYVTGRFRNVSAFGTLNLSSSGNSDIFISKISLDGKVIWARKSGGTSADNGEDIMVDSAGYLYLTGYYKDKGNFDEFILYNPFADTPFLARYDNQGNVLCVKQPSRTALINRERESIGIDGSGNSYLLSNFASTANFNGATLVSNGGDFFLAKMGTAPNEISADLLPKNQYCAGAAISVSFSPKGNYETGNIFTLQLSDAIGSFATPVTIGKGSGSPLAGVIPVTTVFGTGYRIRVVSSAPVSIGTTSDSDLTIFPLPTAPLVVSTARCGPGTVNLNASGAPAGGSYRWYSSENATNPIPGQVSGIFSTPILAATTTFYVSIIIEAGCEGPRTPVTATIFPIPEPPAVKSEINYCKGEPGLVLTAAGNNLLWYRQASGGLGVPTAPKPETQLLGMAEYFVSQTVNGCESPRNTIRVIVHPVPEPVAIDNRSCEPGRVILRAQGGTAGNYRWYPTETGGSAIANENNAVFTSPFLSATTAYYVSVINEFGCESPRVKVQAIILPRILVSAGPDQEICESTGEFKLKDFKPAGGTWSGTGTTLEGIFNPASAGPGKHTLTYSFQQDDCILASTKVVTISKLPTITAGVIATDCNNNGILYTLLPENLKFSNTTTGGTGFLWEFGDGTTSTEKEPTHNYIQEGNFEVFLTVSYGTGCLEKKMVSRIKAEKRTPVPNVFTPNGDGLNDTFIQKISCLPVDLKIYNRWGKLVFEQKDYQNNWSGNNLDAGTYYYLLTASNKQTWKGWVEMLK